MVIYYSLVATADWPFFTKNYNDFQDVHDQQNFVRIGFVLAEGLFLLMGKHGANHFFTDDLTIFLHDPETSPEKIGQGLVLWDQVYFG